MMAITLQDFGERDRHFILDDPAGKWAVAKGKSPSIWGYGTLIPQRCGLSKPILVAVLTDRKTILLRVGESLFDLGDKRINLQKSGMLFNKFNVLVDDKAVASVSYSGLGMDYDPWNEDSIFDYLVAMFSDRSQLDRTVALWTATGEGRKCDESLLAELDAKYGTPGVNRPQTPMMKGLLCLLTYWLAFILLPATLVLSLVPKGWWIGVGIPVGFVLLVIGENGFRRWKKLWRVK